MKKLCSKKNDEIAFFLPNLHGGGTERSFVQIANFIAHYNQVTFVLSDASGPYLKELSTKIKLVNLKTTSRIMCLVRLTIYFRRFKPKRVVSALCQANLGAILATRLAGLGNVNIICQRVIFSRAWREWLSPLRYTIHRKIFSFFFRKARLIIANSNSTENDLVSELNLKKSKVTSILNPIDFELINSGIKESLEHKWINSINKVPVLCFVGSLSQRKDVETCLKSFQIILKEIDCRLIIVGDGPQKKQYIVMAQTLGIWEKVDFVGFQINPFKYMHNADILISTSKFEGCPNVIQQALACGARIVATAEPGGTPQVLGFGKYGEMAEVGNKKNIARAVIKTLKKFDTKKDKQVRLDYANTFNPKKAYSKYLSLILK